MSKLVDLKISLGTIIQIITFIFLLGQTYTKLASSMEIQRIEVAEIKESYVRKDVYSENQRRLDERLALLHLELMEIKKELKAINK
jgi:hypothetical protein